MSKKDKKKQDVAVSKGVQASEASAEYPAVSKDAGERLKVVNETLLSILQETSTSEGVDFFRHLLEKLATTLGLRYAMIAEVVGEEKSTIKTLAFYANGEIAENMEFDLAGTPCSEVLKTGFNIYPEKVSSSSAAPSSRSLLLGPASSLSGSALRANGNRAPSSSKR
jgi:hypothetical protein